MSEKTFDLNKLSTRLRNALLDMWAEDIEHLRTGDYTRFFRALARCPNVGLKTVNEAKVALGLRPPDPETPMVDHHSLAQRYYEELGDAMTMFDWQRSARLTGLLSHELIVLRNDVRKRAKEEADREREEAGLNPRAYSARNLAMFHLVVVDNWTYRTVGQAWGLSQERVRQIVRTTGRHEFGVDLREYLWAIRNEFQDGRAQRRTRSGDAGGLVPRRALIQEQQRHGADEGRLDGEVRPRQSGRE